MKNESILTRRGFLRTMGLVVGAAVVAPAALAEGKKYGPDEVVFCINGERVKGLDFSGDFSADEVAASINQQMDFQHTVSFSDGSAFVTVWASDNWVTKRDFLRPGYGRLTDKS